MRLKSFLLPLIFIFSAFLLTGRGTYAQEATPSANPTPTPQAHLTFETCLVPETNVFRLSFRADYVAGEYRVVGDTSDIILNLGYLEVGQSGGGFGESNTTYVLPVEDTWIKQWYNGTRWQRAGGLPVTSIAQHIESGSICETGSHTPYAPSPSPSDSPNGIGGADLLTSSGKRSSLVVGNVTCEATHFDVYMDLFENGTPVKDTEVTFTYHGLTSKAKTNESGRAQTSFTNQGDGHVTADASGYPSQGFDLTPPVNCASSPSSSLPYSEILGISTLAATGTPDSLLLVGLFGLGLFIITSQVKKLA